MKKFVVTWKHIYGNVTISKPVEAINEFWAIIKSSAILETEYYNLNIYTVSSVIEG